MQNKRSTKTNRILSLMLALIMTLGILPAISIPVKAAANTDWYYSNPTASSFTISTADQLAGLAQLVNEGKYFNDTTITLEADINLSEYDNWTPIGDVDNPFAGTFNGNGKVIENLTIDNNTAAYVGLFGVIHCDGTVENVGIGSGSIVVTGNEIYVGGLAGVNNGTIKNCYNSGTVTGTGTGTGTVNEIYIGGLTGANFGDSFNVGEIKNCYNSGTIVGTGDEIYVGGLAGGNYEGTISNCYNSGTVNSTYAVGGLMGENMGEIKNCYNSGAVIGTGDEIYAGGLVGWNDDYGTIENSYNSGTLTVTGDEIYVGGLVGVNYATITDCYYDKDKYNGNSVGIGTSSGTGLITEWMTDNDVLTNSAKMSSLGTTNWVKPVYSTTTNGCVIGYYPELVVFAKDPASDYDIAMSKLSVTATHSCGIIGMDEQYFVDGNGTEGSPYQISTPQQLNHVRRHLDTDEYFEMMCDINLSTYTNWSPIGDAIDLFNGTFDGGGYVITKLTIDNSTDDYVGLFGYIDTTGTIQNLGIDSGTVAGTGTGTGGIVGGVAGWNNGTITNCYNSGTGTVTGIAKGNVGGVVGWNTGKITNCYNTGTVAGTGTGTGDVYVGGVVGWNTGTQNTSFGTITNCYNSGTVTGNSSYVGGLVGMNDTDATITNCYYDTDKYSGNAVGNSTAATNSAGLTTAEMVMSNVLTSTMSGLGTEWSKRAENENYWYYPELTVFYEDGKLDTPQKIASEISVRVNKPAQPPVPEPTPPEPPTPNPNPPFFPPYNPPLNNETTDSSGDSSNGSNNGTGSNPPAVDNTITVTTDSGLSITFTYVYTPTGGIVLTASAAAILKVASNSDDSAILSIPLPSGKYIEISFDNIALEAIAKQAGKLGNVSITIEIVDKTKLSRKEQNLVGDNLVFEFIIMGVRKDERITDLKGGTITVTFSRGLTSGENNHDRTIFYRNSENQVKKSNVGKYHARKNGVNNVVSFTFTGL